MRGGGQSAQNVLRGTGGEEAGGRGLVGAESCARAADHQSEASTHAVHRRCTLLIYHWSYQSTVHQKQGQGFVTCMTSYTAGHADGA